MLLQLLDLLNNLFLSCVFLLNLSVLVCACRSDWEKSLRLLEYRLASFLYLDYGSSVEIMPAAGYPYTEDDYYYGVSADDYYYYYGSAGDDSYKMQEDRVLFHRQEQTYERYDSDPHEIVAPWESLNECGDF